MPHVVIGSSLGAVVSAACLSEVDLLSHASTPPTTHSRQSMPLPECATHPDVDPLVDEQRGGSSGVKPRCLFDYGIPPHPPLDRELAGVQLHDEHVLVSWAPCFLAREDLKESRFWNGSAPKSLSAG